MSNISRRKFLTVGLAASAGLSGLGIAASLAKRYGLVPPDSGGIYGPGETLTYAAQRLLARHSLTRQFPRSLISKVWRSIPSGSRGFRVRRRCLPTGSSQHRHHPLGGGMRQRPTSRRSAA
jgi:hypothetical protein